MSLIYVFSDKAFDEALNAYVDEATATYPDSAALIHIVRDAMRDFMKSEYATKLVAGSSATAVADFGEPMPEPPVYEGQLTHPEVTPVQKPSRDNAPASPVSWDDMKEDA